MEYVGRGVEVKSAEFVNKVIISFYVILSFRQKSNESHEVAGLESNT